MQYCLIPNKWTTRFLLKNTSSAYANNDKQCFWQQYTGQVSMAKCFWGRSGHNGMYGGWIYKVVYLPMQSVPITTNVSSNLAHGDMYSIKHCVIKFVCGFLRVLRFPTPKKTDCHDISEILLKVVLKTIAPNPIVWDFYTMMFTTMCRQSSNFNNIPITVPELCPFLLWLAARSSMSFKYILPYFF